MNSSLFRNAAANVAQMLIGAALLFILYRYINDRLGVGALGIWSVVLATVSASRLADFGLGASVTRFVARDLARANTDDAARAVETVALTLMVLLGLVLPWLYIPFLHLLPHLFAGEHLAEAESILPYALLSLWLMVIAAVFQSGLDGCQRMDLRAGLMVAGQGLLLAMALWLVPREGLVGLALAQIGQGIFLVIAGWLLLRRALGGLPWIPYHWSGRRLREMLPYGANVQAAGIFMLLFDPVAKALMARFGGVEAAGYFEMANQVVLKVRALIVAANQAVVPRIAELAETASDRLPEFYRQNMRILLFVALPTFSLLVVWGGAVSWLLTGRMEPKLMFLLDLLASGWFVNVFNVPAYFANQGGGSVGWNTLVHAAMGVLNGGLGWWLGGLFGMAGVAWAYVLSLAAGSGLLILVYQRRAGISVRSMRLGQSAWLAMTALIAALGSGRLWTSGFDDDVRYWPALLLLLSLVVVAAVWLHPLRREMWGRVVPEFRRGQS